MTQSANVTLALGASPIMATAAREMEDLSKVSGALLVNFGTIADKAGMLEAGDRHNYIQFTSSKRLNDYQVAGRT